jgi:hypothetical protein
MLIQPSLRQLATKYTRYPLRRIPFARRDAKRKPTISPELRRGKTNVYQGNEAVAVGDQKSGPKTVAITSTSNGYPKVNDLRLIHLELYDAVC